MAFIIYKLYLNQYWKASKFHSHWEPAGQAALPCRHLQILNLWTGDHGARWGPSTWGRAVSKALPPQPHHLETCTILPFFQLAHLFRSKHRQGEKNLRSMVFSQFPPPLWAPPYPSVGHLFPNASKPFSPTIFKKAPKLFHMLRNFFRYSLFYFDWNENWLCQGATSRAASEVGNALLYAANPHPGLLLD